MRGDDRVEGWGPLATLATMTLLGVIGWRSLIADTLSTKGGSELLEKGAPHPCPSGPLLCQRRGSEESSPSPPTT